MSVTSPFRGRDMLETSSLDNQTSPVTWQVVFWTLSALAISSMTQLSGRWCGQPIPRAYRLYICISPITCLADALSIVCGVMLTRYMFDIPILNAIRYVDFWRSKVDMSEGTNEIERPNPRSGPRWVLFIIGTLPALIKIVSFSGVPWSQCWGLMFGLSYLVIEVVNIASSRTSQESLNSTAAALGYSLDRWDLDVNSIVRMKAESLDEGLFVIGYLAWHLAFVAHGILALWVVHDLRRLLPPGSLFGANQVDHPILLLSLPFAFSYVSAIALGVYQFTPTDTWRRLFARARNEGGVRLLDDRSQQVYASSWPVTCTWMNAGLATWWQRLSSHSWTRKSLRIISYPITRSPDGRRVFVSSLGFTMILNFVAPLIGSGYQNPYSHTIASNVIAIPIGFFVVVGCLMFVVLTKLCSTAPFIGKALLVMKSVEIVDDADESGLRHVDLVDWYGVIWVIFFCLHLFLGVMWYAKMYDPSGTTNPSWTNVFG